MLHPMFDEIQAASTCDLQEMLERHLKLNVGLNGYLNPRIEEIVNELQARYENRARDRARYLERIRMLNTLFGFKIWDTINTEAEPGI